MCFIPSKILAGYFSFPTIGDTGASHMAEISTPDFLGGSKSRSEELIEEVGERNIN